MRMSHQGIFLVSDYFYCLLRTSFFHAQHAIAVPEPNVHVFQNMILCINFATRRMNKKRNQLSINVFNLKIVQSFSIFCSNTAIYDARSVLCISGL